MSKIVEGLKRLRVIEKKMQQNLSMITRYSSLVSTERPLFDTEDAQKKEVKKLIQSNTDLLQEYLKLKRRIEETNLRETVEMNGTNYSLADLLVLKRKLANLMVATFNSLNDQEGRSRLNFAKQTAPDGKTPHVVRFYREEEKNEGLRAWQDFYDNIDSRLEVINATTDLVE